MLFQALLGLELSTMKRKQVHSKGNYLKEQKSHSTVTQFDTSGHSAAMDKRRALQAGFIVRGVIFNQTAGIIGPTKRNEADMDEFPAEEMAVKRPRGCPHKKCPSLQKIV